VLTSRHWEDKSKNRELTEGKSPKNIQNIFNRNLRRKKMFLVSTRENPHCNRIPKACCYAASKFSAEDNI